MKRKGSINTILPVVRCPDLVSGRAAVRNKVYTLVLRTSAYLERHVIIVFVNEQYVLFGRCLNRGYEVGVFGEVCVW